MGLHDLLLADLVPAFHASAVRLPQVIYMYLFVCVCVCVCVRVCIHKYICMYIYMYIFEKWHLV
jgi:hypothetical protein